MYKEKKFLCVIPARKGSKRIKWKNIVPLAGKPLLEYTIECAEAIEKLVNNDFESLVSISALKVRPELMRKFYDDKNIIPIFNEKETGNLLYRVNGAIYINKINKNLNKNTILANNNLAYIMDKKTSVDIDTIEDIEIAEYYLETKKG